MSIRKSNLALVKQSHDKKISLTKEEILYNQAHGSRQRFVELLCQSVCADLGISGVAKEEFIAQYNELLSINPAVLNELFAHR